MRFGGFFCSCWGLGFGVCVQISLWVFFFACESILYLIIDFLVNKHRLGYGSLVRLSKLLNFVHVGSDSVNLLFIPLFSL